MIEIFFKKRLLTPKSKVKNLSYYTDNLQKEVLIV